MKYCSCFSSKCNILDKNIKIKFHFREPPASARNSFELPERPPKKQKEYEEKMKQMQEDGGGGGEGDPMSPKLDDKKPGKKYIV